VIAEKWLPEDEIDHTLADPADRHDIEVALRAEVLNAGVSLSEGFRAFTASDTQVQAALALFDEAAKLNARARIGGTTTRAAAAPRAPERAAEPAAAGSLAPRPAVRFMPSPDCPAPGSAVDQAARQRLERYHPVDAVAKLDELIVERWPPLGVLETLAAPG